MFQRAWNKIALQRRLNNVDTLESFLRPPKDGELPFPPGFKLAVDFGWMIERLLEMISMPDALVNTADTLGTLQCIRLYSFAINSNIESSTRLQRVEDMRFLARRRRLSPRPSRWIFVDRPL